LPKLQEDEDRKGEKALDFVGSVVIGKYEADGMQLSRLFHLPHKPAARF